MRRIPIKLVVLKDIQFDWGADTWLPETATLPIPFRCVTYPVNVARVFSTKAVSGVKVFQCYRTAYN